MRKREWRNVPGECVTDVVLVLPFLSSGYYDPGVTNGPPERCYPPEGDDERLPNGVAYLDLGTRDNRVEFTKEQTERLFELLESEIHEAELEEDER